MIEESYVSFETAKILKEAGFRELTKTHYSNSGQIWETAMPADYNDDFNCNTCNRPTQALAARWLSSPFPPNMPGSNAVMSSLLPPLPLPSLLKT